MQKKTNKVINLKSFLPYRLSVLEQQISRAISSKYSENFKLSRMQWRVLSTLALYDNITARDICEFTHMEKMQASRAISGLLSEGLLNQEKHPEDLRAQVLSLSARGWHVYRQIVPEVLQEEQRIFSSLSPEEQQTLHHLVDKLFSSLDP